MKININRKKVEPEELAKHKNFRNVLDKVYKRPKPFYKTPKFFSGIIAIMAVIAVLILQMQEEQNKVRAFINPPLPKMEVPYDTITLFAEQAQQIFLKDGSVMKVPANSFSMANVPITGKIQLLYRRYSSLEEIFLSGIPMTYDSAKTQYHFQSAGMVELRAVQNEKELQIAPKKAISLLMASKDSTPVYNIYRLDTLKRNWEFISNDPVTDSESTLLDKLLNLNPLEAKSKYIMEASIAAKEYRKRTVEVKSFLKSKPLRPKAITSGRMKFKIDVLLDEFPEFKPYQNFYFEVLPENRHYSPKDADQIWEDVSMKQITDSTYEITFISSAKMVSYKVQPGFEQQGLIPARKNFENEFAKYQAALDKRIESERLAKVEYEKKVKFLEERRALLLEQWIADRQKQEMYSVTIPADVKLRMEKRNEELEQLYALQSNVNRELSINKVGIWNCDQIQRLNADKKIMAKYVDKDGNSLIISNFWLIDKESNFAFTIYNPYNLMINSKKEYAAWGITADGNLAVLDPKFTWNSISHNGTFKMNLYSRTDLKPGRLKQILKIQL